MKRNACSVAALALASAAGVPEAQGDGNLVANGDFEQVDPGPHLGCHFSFPDTPLPGWQLEGWHDVDGDRNTPACAQHGPVFHPAGGLIVVSLQGSICCGCDNNGAIFQSLALRTAAEYCLLMDVLLDPFDELRVSVGGASWSVFPETPYEWQTIERRFVAAAEDTVLRLASVGTSAAPECLEADWAVIDNVRIEDVTCTADVDGDTMVNSIDLGIVLAEWGTDGGKFHARADVDGSGTIDAADLAAVLFAWGACP